MVKKRRKLDRNNLNDLTRPVSVTKKASDDILPNIQDNDQPQRPTNINPPTPTSSPIPHRKHIISPGENFPAIIVTPRSTQGIISSQEILERNRRKKIDTLNIERDHTEERLYDQVSVSIFPLPEERFSEIGETDLSNFENQTHLA